MNFENQQSPTAPAAPVAPAPTAAPIPVGQNISVDVGKISSDGVQVALDQLRQQKAGLDAQWTALRRQLEGMTQTNAGRPAVAQQWATVGIQRAEIEGQIARLQTQLGQMPGQPIIVQPTDRDFPVRLGMQIRDIAGILLATAIVLPISIAWAMRMVRRSKAPPPPRVEDSNRLERMEQALDAIAIEVERVSESQRFLTKIMAEKSGLNGATPAAPALGAGPAEPIVIQERESERVGQ